MTQIIINEENTLVGVSDANNRIVVTTSNLDIPVINFGAVSGVTVYEKSVSGTILSGTSGNTGRVWTLDNTGILITSFIVRDGSLLNPSEYTITATGLNDTVTFTNINIWNEDNLRIIGFK